MDKKNKIIITIGILIIIAATVLIITLVDGMTEDKNQGYTGVYTLQPTTTQTQPVATDSWIDLNLIASDLATATDTSNESTTGVITTIGGVQGYVFDIYGNLVDSAGNIIVPANQIGNNQGITQNNNTGTNNRPVETTIDTTTALDIPVDNGSELGEFEIDEKGVLTEYLGDKQDVIIPDKVNGVYITGIGQRCFEGSDIKSVYIPDTVVAIGNFAFKNCTRLTEVVFVVNSNKKVAIGSSAFENCVSLKNINLPAVELGNSAFGNCTALEKAKLAEGSKSIGSYCFSNCTALKHIEIPESVPKENIGTGVLEGANMDVYIVTPSGSEAGQFFGEKGYKVTTHE